MQIKYIDGIRLQKAVHAGINHVINRKDYLNKINVFPFQMVIQGQTWLTLYQPLLMK